MEVTYQNHIRSNKVSIKEEHYKLFDNDLLHMIVSMCAGTRIGQINCSAPSCWDDLAGLASLASLAIILQMILCIVEYYKNSHRYCIQTVVYA